MNEYITLPNGKTIYRVSHRHYVRCEHIRNYILRTNYETGESIERLKVRACKLWHTSMYNVEAALKDFQNWYYTDGNRHIPIERFIEQDKSRRFYEVSVEHNENK